MKIPFTKKEEPKKVAAVKVVKEKKISKKPNNDRLISAWKNIIRPIISEKSTMLNKLNQYVFEVSNEVNRVEIKKGIAVLYNVDPVKVNIIPVKSRFKRYGKTSGWTMKRKKAIITLKKGDIIEVSKGV